MKLLDRIALTITIIGALSWLLIGIFDFNIITAIFGDGTGADIVYVIVGIAALWTIKFYGYTPDRSYRRR